MDGTYDTHPYFFQGEYDWEDLIPHLKISRLRDEEGLT